MSRIKTHLIGRHPKCDLRLDDSSVSRRHAEVVLMPDGRYHITDRNSTGGTYVYENSDWRAIRQVIASAGDRLRLGHCEIAASRLESLRVLSRQHGGAKDAKRAAGNAPGDANKKPDDRLDADKGLRFNPETGEVIEQSNRVDEK
ncbi:MAG: FHA domain-containing protein [Gammaproteobacteria bacterium]